MRRVVVTGMGAITPLGLNVQTFFENIKAGNHGFGVISKFDASGYKAKALRITINDSRACPLLHTVSIY